ncbi:glyoxalase [Galbitalea sp. SE-J8]|uniref:VOC family protein n=1 Tax=Galbitalea sp. SE-J8 TaxID=3054952 RepID=UPI00259CAC59|nr:VOC family protein [Galbitalea sp. SE-J8]MDM4761731.1 glyoxalase [Galbitalea sp. SE-J8]
MAGFHHVEVWVADLESVDSEWAWLLTRVGFALTGDWSEGRTWSAGGAYLTLTMSPNLSAAGHDRRGVGVNHLAFKSGGPTDVDSIMIDAPQHGWKRLYHDRYPHAGGPDHYAGWLENAAGFKVEIVAE